MKQSPFDPIIKLTSALLLSLMTMSVWADSLEQNYAWVWTLDPDREESVWRIPLTEKLMSDLHSERANDLVLVDARGQEIPFTRLPDSALIEALEQTHELDIESALVEKDHEHPEALELIIDHDGTRMRVRSPRTEPRDSTQGALVFQALIGAPAERPDWPEHLLELELTSADPLSIDCRLRDAGDVDPARLRVDFRAVGDSRPRRYEASQSIQELPAGWHLSCFGTRTPTELEMSAARLVSSGQRDYRQNHVLAVKAERLEDQPGRFEFELDGPYRTHALTISSDEPNLVSRIEVFSRVNEERSWRARGITTLSTLESEQARLEFADEPAHRDRYWQVRTEPALEQLPEFEMETWQDELAFLARGQAPWRLYAGSRQSHELAEPAGWLDETIQRLGPAWNWPSLEPTQREQAGGPPVLETPLPPIPWQRYLLWAVLVLAAGLVIYLAMHLLSHR